MMKNNYLRLCLCAFIVSACSLYEPRESVSGSVLIARYAEYVSVLENEGIQNNANAFLSDNFYQTSKDEIKKGINLKERGTIQFTYMPSTNLKNYHYKFLNGVHCLKLDGTDINERKVSILLDYINEDNIWKIDQVYTQYLESDPYDSSIICAQEDDLLKPL